MPLIAALLGLPTEGRYPALDLTPQRQKQLTLAALVEQLEGLATAQPVLLAYEDMHWSDPTTQELLGLTIERLQRLPVLLLITYRPEFARRGRGRTSARSRSPGSGGARAPPWSSGWSGTRRCRTRSRRRSWPRPTACRCSSRS